jgi:hypothetical protein
MSSGIEHDTKLGLKRMSLQLLQRVSCLVNSSCEVNQCQQRSNVLKLMFTKQGPGAGNGGMFYLAIIKRYRCVTEITFDGAVR